MPSARPTDKLIEITICNDYIGERLFTDFIFSNAGLVIENFTASQLYQMYIGSFFESMFDITDTFIWNLTVFELNRKLVGSLIYNIDPHGTTELKADQYIKIYVTEKEKSS